MNEQIEQALAQLRKRIEELRDLAPAHELARDIDQLQVVWLERYTVRKDGPKCR